MVGVTINNIRRKPASGGCCAACAQVGERAQRRERKTNNVSTKASVNERSDNAYLYYQAAYFKAPKSALIREIT
jgi:hypothetical protein